MPLAVGVIACLVGDVQRLAGRYVQLGADAADALQHLLQPGDVVLGLGVGVSGFGVGLQHDAVALDRQRFPQALPDFLGDKGHERVQRAQGGFQHVQQGVAGRVLFLLAATLQDGL